MGKRESGTARLEQPHGQKIETAAGTEGYPQVAWPYWLSFAAIPAGSFARAVAFANSQPEDVDINEIVFRPTKQELLSGRGWLATVPTVL